MGWSRPYATNSKRTITDSSIARVTAVRTARPIQVGAVGESCLTVKHVLTAA